MATMNRRKMMAGAGRVTMAAAAMAAVRPVRAQSPAETVRLGLIGAGGRGRGLAQGFAERKDAVLTTICDLDAGKADLVSRMVEQTGKPRPAVTTRMQEIFDDKDVDVAVIATPDHWHVAAAIRACQAGKDVYVEKPVTYNIWEGGQLVAAAKKYGRIVQAGTQSRSGAFALAARQYIAEGNLGAIHLVKVFNLKSGGPFHLQPDAPQPVDFDWKAWLGPAPYRPYNPHIVRKGWHHFWAYNNGDMGDAIHQMDLARMLLGDPPDPVAVHAAGGRMAHRGDDSEIPDVQMVNYEFPAQTNMVMTLNLTNYPVYMAKTPNSIRESDEFPFWQQNATRIEIYGSKQMMIVGRHGGGWQAFSHGGKVEAQMYGRHPDPEHKQNFLDCIRSRKSPNSDVAKVVHSDVLCHLANISLRIGDRVRYDATTRSIPGNEEASRLLKRSNTNEYSIPQVV